MNIYENLTEQEKQYYADILNYIFKGTIGNVQSYQVTPNVAKAADFFMKEILNCASGLKGALYVFVAKIAVDVLFDVYIGNGGGKKEIKVRQLITEGISSNIISSVLDAIYSKFAYRACIDRVNLNWKSQMGLLLNGIIDDLPY